MGQFLRHTFQGDDIHMLKTGNFADGIIKCHDRTWKVHRSLLASRLQFFRAAFYGKFSVGISPGTTVNDSDTNRQEASSGEVDFPEADPASVDIMLRHLYSEDLNVEVLNTPTSCIRCWKLADYLQLNSLKFLAEFTLQQHLDAMALLACSNVVAKAVRPKWMKYFFDAIREVCNDAAMKPLQTTFVAFLWVTRYELLALSETLEFLEQWPQANQLLLKLLIGHNFDERPSWIPNRHNIEWDIQTRFAPSFPEEITCSGCGDGINTREETVSYNPFPVDSAPIGELKWCKGCVFTINDGCHWPWQRRGWMNDDRVQVGAWNWSDEV